MLRKVILVLVLAFFGVIRFSYGESPPEERHPQANTCQSVPQPVSGAHPVTKGAKAIKRQRNADEMLMDWLLTFMEFRLTDVFLAIFTGVLAAKTSGLFRETEALRKGADEQGADILRSIRAAETSANAAKESAKAASIEVTGLQRPYIYIFGVGEPECYGADHNPGLGYTIANYGKTPAKVIYLNISFSVGHPEKIPGRADVDNPFVIDNVVRMDEKRSITSSAWTRKGPNIFRSITIF
jgi:hypothetical protein